MIRIPQLRGDAAERPRQAARPKGNGRCFRIQNAAADEATVYLFGEISWWGQNAERLSRELDAITASTIHLRINSPGGDVFEGVAIYNAFANHPARVITHVDGLAASIASVIALAGDEIRMARGAFLMIHNPWTGAIGDARELRKVADLLDKVGGSLAGMYAERTGNDLDDILQQMEDETWFTADEAVEAGFADQVEDAGGGATARTSFDLSAFRRVPVALAASAEPAPSAALTTVRQLETFLREEGGFSRAAAAAIARGGFKPQSDPREEDDEAFPVAAIEQLIATLTP